MKKFEINLNQTRWVDLVHPSKEELVALSSELQVPERILLNALDPEHLPKFEALDKTNVIFLRIIDPNKKAGAINIQELTTKVTLIVQEGLILSIHRLDPDFIAYLRDEVQTEEGRNYSQKNLIKKIINAAIKTFDQPINDLEKSAEDFEAKIFQYSKNRAIIREGYTIKRKASAYRKVLKFSLDILNALDTLPDFLWNDFVAIRETTDRYLFYTEDVLENLTGLLNLHISLAAQKTNEASYKTNEVMRILTVFSIFFLPLNFLAGIYGMNFENMPELKHPMGYKAALAVMGLISIVIFIWVKKRGWLKKED